MTHKFFEVAFTPRIIEEQRKQYGTTYPTPRGLPDDRLGAAERAFVEARDSFYVASVSESGWPYVQHRGGEPGFLRVLDDSTLVFPDYSGNRQLVTTGNLAHDDRVALFLMDYRGRRRLKILGHADVLPIDAPELAGLDPHNPALGDSPPIERVFRIRVVAFDWNCPKFIPPRFTADEVAQHSASLEARIGELETQLASVEEGPPAGQEA